MYPQIHWLIIIFPVKMATGRVIIVSSMFTQNQHQTTIINGW